MLDSYRYFYVSAETLESGGQRVETLLPLYMERRSLPKIY